MEPWSEEPRHQFTVEDVSQMLRAGILDEDDRVELIEGELLVMSPNDPPHAGTVYRLQTRLARAYGARACVRAQLPLDISRTTEPEPDITVARGAEDTYDNRHPTGPDCILVVEVSWSSRARDIRKARLYAAAGVEVYWILDVELRRLQVHERPKGDGTYSRVQILEESEEIALPDSTERWKVADLLPRA